MKSIKRVGALRRSARLLGCAGLSLALGACVSANPFATAKVDPASPIAQSVAEAARSNRDFPTFSDIPEAPTESRPLRAWGKAAADTESARERLELETAARTWSLGGTEGFASRANAAAGRESAPGADEQADTEAFAKALRERATPPPPPR